MKCLLVDDEPGIREGLAALLRRKGHDVRTAGDCAAAATALTDQAYDVVITDWRLPDGLAARFLMDCPHPVVAMSGHPEEVEAHAIVHTVLSKPVVPSCLLSALAATQRIAAAAEPTDWPIDVRHVLAAAEACLPAGTACTIEDDGTFVVLRAALADDEPVARLAALGGDLRVLHPPAGLRVELRLCRCGRPDTSVPAVMPESAWPDHGEFAVDFHGVAITEQRFAACLERIRVRSVHGQRVHLCNIPPALAAAASDWEKTNDMPMKEPVGPRLPAVLRDLWS